MPSRADTGPGPSASDLTRRLVDDGRRWGGDPSPGLTQRVTAGLAPREAAAPPRPSRRTGLPWAWALGTAAALLLVLLLREDAAGPALIRPGAAAVAAVAAPPALPPRLLELLAALPLRPVDPRVAAERSLREELASARHEAGQAALRIVAGAVRPWKVLSAALSAAS